MADHDRISGPLADLVRALRGAVGWNSLPADFWRRVTRRVGEGIGRFLLGIGLVTAVIFAFVALAMLS